jgi:hypothetical protein
MRTFSRWMPSRQLSGDIALLAPLAGGALVLVIRYPWVLIGAVGVVAIGHVLDRGRRERLRAWATERRGEGLCTFARAFPRNQRDGWVLRAVYEELQPHYTIGCTAVPPRPADFLHADLQIDPDDMEFIALNAATRARRNVKDWQENPYRDRVLTVADLVALIGAQPRGAVGQIPDRLDRRHA